MDKVKDDSLTRIRVNEIDYSAKTPAHLNYIWPKSLEGANYYNGLILDDTTVEKLKVFTIDHTHGKSNDDSDYSSKFDGLIGIAPPDSDSRHVQDSFLW